MTVWRAQTAYRCRHCRANCINRFDELVTKLGECRECHGVPDLELDYPLDHLEDNQPHPDNGLPVSQSGGNLTEEQALEREESTERSEVTREVSGKLRVRSDGGER